MGSYVPDWEYLPELYLLTVLKKIDEPISWVQFGAVSKYWYLLFNTFLDIKRRSSTNLVPMLMIPSKKSATKRKIYSLQAKSKIAEIEFPKPYTWRYCGTCYGLVYAIGHYNNLVWFDVNGVEDDESSKPPKLNTLVPKIRRLENYSHRAYLVRSSMGNLYSIHKHLKFEEVGERSRPNSIYFADEFIDTDTYEPFGLRDIGIFHLKDGSLEKYYQFNPHTKIFLLTFESRHQKSIIRV
ncbi:hypothetical protein CXB51_015229 [Gossypium anomalum]|uniref:Uncharacterized protein n=1 Tax=Gossypium anomalum TaxID=47600 RepID=A0A8J5YKW3_9ROSI|nr:hypothetical protein CXB51_015229 [Gossypium anomalum]